MNDGPVPASALLETVHQMALRTAGHAHGLKPTRSMLASLLVHFRGYAEPDLPLRCAASWEQLGQDGTQRRRVPVALTLIQAGRAVMEAAASVVEDL